MADEKKGKRDKDHDDRSAEDKAELARPAGEQPGPAQEQAEDQRDDAEREAQEAHEARIAASPRPEIADESKHPLDPPYEPKVEVDGLTVLVLESTIGVHDFKLEWIDPNTNMAVGYGWFNAPLAAKMLGEPYPEGTLPRGSQHPDAIMASARARDRQTLASLDSRDGVSDTPASTSSDGEHAEERSTTKT